jgi:hypothetical protein
MKCAAAILDGAAKCVQDVTHCFPSFARDTERHYIPPRAWR